MSPYQEVSTTKTNLLPSATCSGVTALESDGLRSRFVEVILETIGEIAATSHILSILSSSVSRQTHVSSQ
jgi:hypothetical protein